MKFIYQQIIFLHLTSVLIWCTTDISLPELQYVANHLEPEECWKLSIILHSSSFAISNNVEKNQEPLSTEVNCLELLLHWNSQPNEGLDETQAVLAHRLRQIGRKDLSNWLTKTVFIELAKDINQSILVDPFKLLIVINHTEFDNLAENNTDIIVTNHNIWKPYDTVLTLIIILLCALLIWLTCQLLLIKLRRKTDRKFSKRKKTYQGYTLLTPNEKELEENKPAS